MIPAQQRLDTADALLPCVENRLVRQRQFAVLKCTASSIRNSNCRFAFSCMSGWNSVTFDLPSRFDAYIAMSADRSSSTGLAAS